MKRLLSLSAVQKRPLSSISGEGRMSHDGGVNHDKIPFDDIEQFVMKNI